MGTANEVSRLRIRVACDAANAGRRDESLIQRMCAHLLEGPRHGRAPLALEICDLQGHEMLALDAAGPWVEVALPPGTYHVSTQSGATRRCYTVALAQGQSFDLDLRLAGQRH